MRKKELKAELGYALIRSEDERFINEGLRKDNEKIKEELTSLKNERKNLAFALRLAEALGDKLIYSTNIEISAEAGGYNEAVINLTGEQKALYGFCMVIRDGA